MAVSRYRWAQLQPAAQLVAIGYLRYLKDWMANGVNALLDPTSKLCLGRSEPVMLVNLRPDWDAIDAEIRVLQERGQ